MTRFEKMFVWVATILTFLTGVGYLWTKYALEPETAWAVVNHPLQPWFLRLHVLVSPLLVFAIGGVTFRHAWHQYRARRPHGRRTGIITVSCSALMIGSGYFIQVITHVGWLKAMAYAHIALGSVYVAAFVAHELRANRVSQNADRSSEQSGNARREVESLSWLERRRQVGRRRVTPA